MQDRIKTGSGDGIMNDLEVIKHFFEKLLQYPGIKIVAGFFLWALHLCFGNEMRTAYITIPILCFVDFLTGYYHAWANPAITPTSAKLRAGLTKILVYGSILLVSYQFSKFPIIAFLQGIIEASIILTEGYSVLENVEKITVLKGIDIPILKAIMAKIKGKTDEVMK